METHSQHFSIILLQHNMCSTVASDRVMFKPSQEVVNEQMANQTLNPKIEVPVITEKYKLT